MASNHELRQLVARMYDALRYAEWSSWPGRDVEWCRACGGYKPGHKAECWYKAVIEEARAEVRR